MSNPIPLSLNQPYRFDQPLDFDDARVALRAVAEARRQAREWKQRAMHDEAEKERRYRRARADAWVSAPEGTAKLREDWVNDHTADARYERDIAQRIVKAADERLAEIDGERASLHRLVDWSLRVNPLAAQEPGAGEPRTFGRRNAA